MRPPPRDPARQSALGRLTRNLRRAAREPALQGEAAGRDPLTRAVQDAIRPGLLVFNPPGQMTQGRKERVEVGIARSPELRQALLSGLRGRGEARAEQVDTSPVMGVELKGTSFEIAPLSPPEQIVAPLARWEYDVRPRQAGLQTLTLCVCLRITTPPATGISNGQIAVPVLERDIRIKVNIPYGTRRFITGNWQWLIGTAIALGACLAAWLTFLH
jgi:hypothetical protein